MHPSACQAAVAVEAARRAGPLDAALTFARKLWDHQELFADLPPDQIPAEQKDGLSQLAAANGIEPAGFQNAMKSTETAAAVQADVELAHSLGITVVPTVYVNGRFFRNRQKKEAWEALLAASAPATTSRATSQPR